MISIKKYLNGSAAASTGPAASSDAFERMAHLVLQAIDVHAVEGDLAELEGFRSSMTALRTSLSQNPSPDNILVVTGGVVNSLQDYNRRTSLFVKAKSLELQSIVEMLTRAMSHVSVGSQNSISQLQQLQKQIESAAMVEDVRTLKLKLSDCLTSIRDECERKRGESARAVIELQQGIQKFQEKKPELDQLTGLPMRPEAEAAIRDAYQEKEPGYLAVFKIDRIQAINARFGSGVGDKVILCFLQHVSHSLALKDCLFRWTGKSFVALLERSAPGDRVRSDMAQMVAGRMSQTFEVGGRSIVLPISATWLVIPLVEHTYAELLQKVESFCGS